MVTTSPDPLLGTFLFLLAFSHIPAARRASVFVIGRKAYTYSVKPPILTVDFTSGIPFIGYLLSASPDGAATPPGDFLFSERAVENILQGNVQIIEQTALEMGFHRCPLLLGHLRQHPVGTKRINVMENKTVPIRAIDLYGLISGAYDPVFPDTA